MKFAATGDFLIQISIPENHKGIESIRSFMSDADVRMTNLETTITNGDCYCNCYYCDTMLTASPKLLNDVKKLGIQVCGCANNHSTDYGIPGLLSTIKYLDEAGLEHCGIGHDMIEASGPATINTKEGNVAVFAQACLNRRNESGRAGYSHDGIPARPGVNCLRRVEESLVTKEQMDYIRTLASETMVNAQEELEKAYGVGDLEEPNTFSYGLQKFVVSEKTGKNTRVNEVDMVRTEKAIADAKLNHMYAITMIHSHQFKGRREEEVDYFIEEYAHRCIDAGADAVVGAGNHLLKGIEIYKGKPIFYCLGNFIFTTDYTSKTPADMMEMLGFPLSMTGAEVVKKRIAKGSASMERSQVFYLSVVPKWTMEKGVLKEIKLLPIELGLHEPKGLKGFPSPINPQLIFDTLQELSAPYGTELKINGDTIDVVL